MNRIARLTLALGLGIVGMLAVLLALRVPSAVEGSIVEGLALTTSVQPAAHAAGNTIHVPDDYATIQAAIDAATDGDTILVAAGTYTENLSITEGITLTGGWDPTFTTRQPGDSIINGNHLGRVISITCAVSDTVVTIDGFTVQNGDASGLGAPEVPEFSAAVDLPFGSETLLTARAADPGSPSEQAAELRARLADLLARGLYPGGPAAYQAMLERLEWRTAQAERARAHSSLAPRQNRPAQGVGVGGGIYSYNASLHLYDCTVEGNVANQNGAGVGGGVYVGEAPSNGVHIVGNWIEANVASNYGDGMGGGMILFQAPGAVVTHNIFDENVASVEGKGQGGGLFVQDSPDTHLVDDEFLGNSASNEGDGYGGGLLVTQSPGIMIEHDVFFENIASDAGETSQGFGGGLMVDSSPDAVVRDNEVERNTANGGWQYGTGAGGGLFLSASDGAVVSDNAFRGNLAALRGMGEGGGLTLFQTQNTRVADNEVTGNWAAMYQAAMFGVGGGIAMDSVYSTTLSANDIQANTAVVYEEGFASGGGVAGSGLGGQTQIVDNNISGNITCYTGLGQGGGLDVEGGQDVVVTGNTIVDNVASLQEGQSGVGGGLYLSETTKSLVADNRFQGNRSVDGAGGNGGGLMITNYEGAPGVAAVDANLFLNNEPSGCDVFMLDGLSFTNNVVANNKTSVTGGLGLDYVQEGAVTNNTVVDNGFYGVTIGMSTTMTLTNNIVMSHTVGVLAKDGASATVGYTLWRGNDTDIGGSGVISHTHPVTGTPAFADAANHDYHLTVRSAARDAGDPAGAPPAPPVDRDGVARPQGMAVDLGAYEWRGHWFYLPLVTKE